MKDSREVQLKTQYNKEIKILTDALKDARDLLVLCTFLDKSGQCEKEVEKIDKILGL